MPIYISDLAVTCRLRDTVHLTCVVSAILAVEAGILVSHPIIYTSAIGDLDCNSRIVANMLVTEFQLARLRS